MVSHLGLGEWTVGTIRRSWGSAWYQVEVPPGIWTIHFAAEMLGVWSPLDVYRDRLRGSDRWSKAAERIDFEISFPSSGTYYLELADSGIIRDSRGQPVEDQQRDFLIRVDTEPIDEPPPSAPVITSLSTYTGGTTGPVTLTITGAGLDSNATVSLTRADQPTLTAHSVVGSSDYRTVNATFDLSGATPGDWMLAVTNPDGQTATAPSPFTIEQAGTPRLSAEIVGRDKIRVGREHTYMIRYGNSGDVDMIAPVLVVSALPEILLRHTREREFKKAPLQLLGISFSGRPGILSPGSSYSVPIYLKSTDTGNITLRLYSSPPVTDFSADPYSQKVLTSAAAHSGRMEHTVEEILSHLAPPPKIGDVPIPDIPCDEVWHEFVALTWKSAQILNTISTLERGSSAESVGRYWGSAPYPGIF